jgi:hypothetical protein
MSLPELIEKTVDTLGQGVENVLAWIFGVDD